MDSKEITIHCENNKVPDGSTEHPNEHTPTIDIKPNFLLNLMKHPFFIPGLYTVAGILVFFFLIFVIASHVLFLKVETAVVSTQIETIVAPTNGYITDVYVTLGQTVKKGTPLFKVENFDLERDLHLARVQVSESKLNADYYQQLITNEQQRLKIYKKIGHNRVISRQTMLNIAKQDALMARQNLDRFTILYKKHFISKANWELIHTAYLSAQERLKNSQAEHRMEKHSLHALGKGMYFTGNKTEGIERDLNAEFEAAQKRSHLNEDRVKIYEHLINKLTILAPFDGKVTQILKSAGNTTDTIKPILYIENAQGDKLINAYLTQEEVIKIGSSRTVKIYIPSSGKTYHGNIIEINRTEGFIDAIKAQYRWRDFQLDRSALITIEIQQNDKKDFNEKAFPGMPVIVYFSRHYTL